MSSVAKPELNGSAYNAPAEVERLAEIIRAEKCTSLLEVGSKFGTTLRVMADALVVPSRIVCVDLPKGTRQWNESEPALKTCAQDLRALGHDVHVIWGDSLSEQIVEQVRQRGPYDFAFIDGDHRLPGVTSDWENYGPMARIVAFHDIAWHRAPEWVGVRIDVPQFWNSIKGDYRHEEIRLCPTGKNNGIGVLWR